MEKKRKVGFVKREGKFNKCFEEANAFEGRYKLLMGGAGSGKSCNVAMDYLLKLMDEKNVGAGLLVIRKTEESNRNSTYAEIIAAAKRLCGKNWNKYFRITAHPMNIECLSTGNEIIFRGVNDETQREKLKSIATKNGKICWVWCEEATELRKEDMELIDDRLRGELESGLYYQITMSFNPISATHWIKKRFFDENDLDNKNNNNIFIHTSTFKNNAFIDKQFAKRMDERKTRDPNGYKIYGLGEWGDGDAARILTHYFVKRVSPNARDYDQMAMGMDFGFNHPSVVVLCGIKDGEMHVIKELVCFEMDGEEIAEKMEESFSKEIMLWCDCAEPDRIKRLQRLGWKARGVKKNKGCVNDQIDWLKSHKIFIDPKCEKVICEIENWCWLKDYTSGELLDQPRIGEDDAMAALRYCIEGWRRGRMVDFS